MNRPKSPTRFAPLLALAVLLPLAAPGLAQAPDRAKAALGKSTYRGYCATCHGKEARGDGPVAEYLEPKPSDLTTIRERHGGEFPFERLVGIIDGREEVIQHGRREMPVWGEAFMVVGAADEAAVREKITTLVHFLLSIQEDGAAD